MAQAAFVVAQGQVDNACSLYLAGVDGCCAFSFGNADIAHTLQGNVVQVGATLCIGVVGVPTGGHSGKGLDVFLVVTRVEEQHVA